MHASKEGEGGTGERSLLAMSKPLEVNAGLNGQFTPLVPYLANPFPYCFLWDQG